MYLIRCQDKLEENLLISCSEYPLCTFVMSPFAVKKRNVAEFALSWLSSEMQQTMNERRFDEKLMSDRKSINGGTYQSLEMVFEKDFSSVPTLHDWSQRRRSESIGSAEDLVGYTKFPFQQLISTVDAVGKSQQENKVSQIQRVCLLLVGQQSRFKCGKCLSFFSKSFGVRTYNVFLEAQPTYVLIAFVKHSHCSECEESLRTYPLPKIAHFIGNELPRIRQYFPTTSTSFADCG